MIYLDNNASTPIDDRVLEVLIDSSSRLFGNASNQSHSYGQIAWKTFCEAKASIAESLGFDEREVFFTSGATESLTIAIFALLLRDPEKPDLAISAVEHAAVFSAAKQAVKLSGGSLKIVGVQNSGELLTEDLRSSLNPRTAAFVYMAANNESGVLGSLFEVSEICEELEIPRIVDLTQALGKVELDRTWLEADVICFSGHKINAPKGTGALLIRRSLQKNLFKIFPGGGQQREIRGGTLNVSGATVLAKALEIALQELEINKSNVSKVVGNFIEVLNKNEIEYEIAGLDSERLPNTLMIRFPGIDADLLINRVPQVAFSQASACHFGDDEPSHVLTAMGYSRAQAHEFVRISAGRQNTPTEGTEAGELFAEAIKQIRGGL